MRRTDDAAPAGSRWGLAGVLVVTLLGACDRLTERAPATLVLEGDTIQLAAGVELIDVVVETEPDGSEIEPARVAAAPGDVVRFTAGDNRLHALAFESGLLSEPARAYLEQSNQLRSPPLVTTGTQWVIHLVGAPEGEYPFTCTTHAAHGSILVRARQD